MRLHQNISADQVCSSNKRILLLQLRSCSDINSKDRKMRGPCSYLHDCGFRIKHLLGAHCIICILQMHEPCLMMLCLACICYILYPIYAMYAMYAPVQHFMNYWPQSSCNVDSDTWALTNHFKRCLSEQLLLSGHNHHSHAVLCCKTLTELPTIHVHAYWVMLMIMKPGNAYQVARKCS